MNDLSSSSSSSSSLSVRHSITHFGTSSQSDASCVPCVCGATLSLIADDDDDELALEIGDDDYADQRSTFLRVCVCVVSGARDAVRTVLSCLSSSLSK